MNIFNLQNVYFEIGSLCNLRCSHCYNNSGKDTFNFSINEVEELFIDISRMGCKKMIISGGEPLIQKNIIDLLNLGKNKYGLQFGLVTNGTLVNDDIAKKLSSVVDYIQLSIDGTSPSENDKVRGIGTFEKAMLALELFRKHNIRTVVNFVITENNTNNLYQFLNRLKENKVSKVNFKEIINVGRAKNKIISSSNLLKSVFLELLPIIEELGDDNFEITPPYVSNSRCPLYIEEGYIPNIEIRISYTGQVFLCQKFETEEILSVGNIREESLYNILHSQKYRDLIELVNVSTKFIKKCNGCLFSDMCFRECPAVIIANGIFDYEDSLCELRHLGIQ